MARHASDLELLSCDANFEGDVRLDEPMARHTTYRIGGLARAYVEVHSTAALSTLLRICKKDELNWYVVGKGANLLVSDEGYDGVVIALAGEFRNWHFDDPSQSVVVGAGTMLSRLVQEAFHRGYSGLEFAVGIPGTVGGALAMNAGTRSDWIGSRVKALTVMSATKGLQRLAGTDLTWDYRTSSFQGDEIIVEAELQLAKAVAGSVRGQMTTLLDKRKASQPYGAASCGSVFRNPEGASVGALIEQAGLKGTTIGGAQISDKHANFIVNTGSATAQDVVALINLARRAVKERYGIDLTTEVRFLGFNEENAPTA